MRIPAFALAALLVASSALAQSSPTTITPDRSTTLVSKDINGQRWAIARDHATGAVSGNVFVPGSEDPQFVWCRQTQETNSTYLYDCFGMGRCGVADCATAWTPLTDVALAKSFFAAGAPGPTRTPSPTPTPSGLSSLLGRWRFAFTVVTTFVNTYRLQRVTAFADGTPYVAGLDEFGDPVAAAAIQDLVPGSPLPYDYALIDPGVIICYLFVFDRTASGISGRYYSTDIDDEGCYNVSANGYPLTGTLLSSTAEVASAQSLGVAREALVVEETAAAHPAPEGAMSADDLGALVRALQR